MEPILCIDHVEKIFGAPKQTGTYAVKDASFCLYPGEAVGLVGASGSGKSTLAKLICRLNDVTSGTISFNGTDITWLKGRKLRSVYKQMQMVFQTPQGTFDPRKTLGQGIGESLRNQGHDQSEIAKKVEDLLAQCGLTSSFAGKYPLEVSGGQCQRASLARALAVRPKLLICDEATSSLDVTLQAQIISLLNRLRRDEQMACLFITHNLALAQQFCDRIIVMHDGAIVETGKTDDIIKAPKAAYTQELIRAVL